MNKLNSVPKLNLEPKLKRPLSLWNPIDYLHLLYWLLFFPQAVRWYVDKFGGGYINQDPNANANLKSWRKEWQKIRKNKVQFRLLIQSLIIAISIPIVIALCRLLNYTNIPISLTWVNQFNAFFSFSMVIWMGLFYAVSSGISFSVVSSTPLAISTGIINNNAVPDTGFINMTTAIASGFALGIGISTIVALRGGIATGITGYFLRGLLIGLFLAVGFGVASNGIVVVKEINLLSVIVNCLLFALALQISILRLDCWLLSLFNRHIDNQNWSFGHTTSLPLPFLYTRIKNWLRQDWNHGLNNANKLLQYSFQFVPVVLAVNQVLNKLPSEQLIYRVANLSQVFDSWRLIYFTSASLKQELIKSYVPFGDWFGTKSLWQNVMVAKPRLNTPARATAAGFWYLHKKQPDNAVEAFEKVRSLLYGEEVYTLAKTLALFQPATELDRVANLNVPIFPQDNLLRPNTWQTLNSLRGVVEDFQSIQHSVSRTAKALASNRAIGELTIIIDAPEIIPEAERELIIEIAQNWKQAIEGIAKDIGNIAVTKPVVNPYVIGDPVQGNLFAGREDIMHQLEELWSGDRLQSVVLYGHRRMGKTSILLNLSRYLNPSLKLAYINLLRLGDSSLGVGEILMQVCDGIADVTGVAPPDDNALLELPYRTFERYIKQVGQINQGLIIAIDEFEKIEELITAKLIPTDFLGFLRGIVQMNPRIALIFAGLHTLEEMTGDYFQPFFASVIPLHVGFLSFGATRQILANPSEHTSSNEFVLDFTPQALDLVYELTAGQPYLVQLVGFQLVRHFNQQRFEQGIVRHPLFGVEDIETVVDRQFFQQGRYYFEGVWGQAARGVMGQQEIVRTLATHPLGLSKSALIGQLELESEICEKAIAVLNRHDVIMPNTTGWQIVVELFRQWVLICSK